MQQPLPPPGTGKKRPARKRPLIVGASLVLVMLIITAIIAAFRIHPQPPMLPIPKSQPACIEHPSKVNSNGIGAMLIDTGEYIGISDGTFFFDTARSDKEKTLKCQASQNFGLNDYSKDEGLYWTQALEKESDDAEASIYRENQFVSETSDPYITFIVGVILTGQDKDIGIGRRILQGAYVAQEENNRTSDSFSHSFKVRLLIANFGSEANGAITVAKQIVHAAQADTTIEGVTGLPFISNPIFSSAIKILTQQNIPIVLPAGYDGLPIEQAGNIFHVAPSTMNEGTAGAIYVEDQLHIRNVALFVDSSNAYSSSLAAAFMERFRANGNRIVVTEPYHVGKADSLDQTKVRDALNHLPDLIYFAGSATDANILLGNLPSSGPYANLQVMGGDALYQPGAYIPANYHRLDFTAFAFPDEWPVLGLPQHPFFDEYALDFAGWPPNRGYGFTRPDSKIILSYDAMSTLLWGSQIASRGWKRQFKSTDLQQALTQIKGSQAFQGFSGQVWFGGDGNPINKAIVVLQINPFGFAHMVPVYYGCFRADRCNPI